MPIAVYLILRSARRARLEGREIVVQSTLKTHSLSAQLSSGGTAAMRSVISR
jgi:hypothetical protein